MSSENNKPFKTVVVKYFREKDSKIKVVTTEEKWVGSAKDPVVSTFYEYL